MDTNTLISIIITTKNRYELLIDELDLLSKQTYKNFKVYIVDDNSDDKTRGINLEKYKSIFPIEIIHNTETLNMIRSRNKGLEMADKNSDYFMILDDDNQFEDDFLEKFNQFVNKYSDFGLIEPKNYHRDKKSILYFGCHYNLSNLFPHFGKNEFKGDYLIVDVVANCFLINKELFEKIGSFDEKYIIDFSESEYAYRAKACGFKTCVANIPIYHQATTGKEKFEMFTKRVETRPETYFYTFRNKYVFVNEFGSAWNKFCFFTFYQFITLLGYIYISMRVRSFKLLKLYLSGFLAGNTYIFTKKLLKFKTSNKRRKNG